MPLAQDHAFAQQDHPRVAADHRLDGLLVALQELEGQLMFVAHGLDVLEEAGADAVDVHPFAEGGGGQGGDLVKRSGIGLVHVVHHHEQHRGGIAQDVGGEVVAIGIVEQEVGHRAVDAFLQHVHPLLHELPGGVVPGVLAAAVELLLLAGGGVAVHQEDLLHRRLAQLLLLGDAVAFGIGPVVAQGQVLHRVPREGQGEHGDPAGGGPFGLRALQQAFDQEVAEHARRGEEHREPPGEDPGEEGHQHQAGRQQHAVIGGGVEPDVLPVEEQGQHEDQEHHVLGEALPGREAAAHGALHGVAEAAAIGHAGHPAGHLGAVHHHRVGAVGVAGGGVGGEPAEEQGEQQQRPGGQLHAPAEEHREAQHHLGQAGQDAQAQREGHETGQVQRALGEVLLQLVAEAERVVGLDQAADDEEGTNEDAGDDDEDAHGVRFRWRSKLVPPGARDGALTIR